MLPTKKVFTWTDFELSEMAIYEKSLISRGITGKRYINIQSKFNHRTIPSVAKIHQSKRYKDIFNQVENVNPIGEALPNISQSENDNSLPPETDYFDQKIDSKNFIDELCDTFESGNQTKLVIIEYLNNVRNYINTWSETKVKLGNILATKVKSKTKKPELFLKNPGMKAS